MKHETLAALVLALFLPFTRGRPQAQSNSAGGITTSSGSIVGHASSKFADVQEFLGVPYAQPPVGNLRFAAPQSYNSTGIVNAAQFSPDCPPVGLTSPPVRYPNQTPQFKNIIEAFAGGRGNPQSEDCLTLNIWAKQSANQAKGVLVWFHGGRFTIGDTNTPFYQGQYLAESQDVIFVSVNYRINIFGFSGAPGEPENAGLLDQRKAIEWVRDNIAAFGGDPAKISIMGQSAGGSAVDYYAYAYANDPIVAGIISISGTALSFAANTPEFAQQSFLAAAANVSCYTSEARTAGIKARATNDEIVACMRKVDYKLLLGAIASVKPMATQALAQPVFHPTVDDRTVFTLDQYRTSGAAGSFAQVVGFLT